MRRRRERVHDDGAVGVAAATMHVMAPGRTVAGAKHGNVIGGTEVGLDLRRQLRERHLCEVGRVQSELHVVVARRVPTLGPCAARDRVIALREEDIGVRRILLRLHVDGHVVDRTVGLHLQMEVIAIAVARVLTGRHESHEVAIEATEAHRYRGAVGRDASLSRRSAVAASTAVGGRAAVIARRAIARRAVCARRAAVSIVRTGVASARGGRRPAACDDDGRDSESTKATHYLLHARHRPTSLRRRSSVYDAGAHAQANL